MSHSVTAESGCSSQFHPSDHAVQEIDTIHAAQLNIKTEEQNSLDREETSPRMTIKTHQEQGTSEPDTEGTGFSVSLYKNSVPVLAVSETVDSNNGTDFGYSQKLFHIADGNLYSVFSPIQGRSYGIRPSFLRRQRGAGRQSRGRGRRCHRRGLKFHNFVPSETPMLEKNSVGADESRSHSECMLREEHGTKQITASHWSAATESHHNDETMGSSENLETNSKQDNDVVMEDVSQDMPSVHHELSRQSSCEMMGGHNSSAKMLVDQKEQQVVEEFNHKGSKSQQQGILEMLLSVSKPAESKRNGAWHSVHTKLLNENNAALSKTDMVESEYDNQGDDIIVEWDASSQGCSSSRKHRRKPVQTRRIVPYLEYLTMVEETDEPLDLSCHSREASDVPRMKMVPGSPSAPVDMPTYNRGCDTCFPTFHPVPSICTNSVWNSQLLTPNAVPIASPFLVGQKCESVVQIQPTAQAHHQAILLPNRPPQDNQTGMKNSPLFLDTHKEGNPSEGPKSLTAYVYPFGMAPRQSDLPRQNNTQKSVSDVLQCSSKPINIMPNLPAYHTGSKIEAAKGSIAEQLSMRYSMSSLQPQHSNQEGSTNIRYSTRAHSSSSDSSMSTPAGASATNQGDFKLPRTQRRPSQRTLIRQKLEDAFRQNGFLVKTKQVPVGEATFCKFRQLRKYTRYYLKSWHQHLPEEVHKLWKGFLPPKTAVAQAATGRLEDRVLEEGGSTSSSKRAS